jgi:hypothetical protein
MEHPPTLPSKVDPMSEEARIFGRLSKRREVNIRWRYFTSQWKKTLPPLELTATLEQSTSPDDDTLISMRREKFLLHDANLLQEVRALAGSPIKPPMPRRQRLALEALSPPAESSRCTPSATSFPESSAAPVIPPSPKLLPAPTRFMRRRYRELLAKIPILTPYTSHSKGQAPDVRYDVSLDSATALRNDIRSEARLPDADETDFAWIAFGGGTRTPSRTGNADKEECRDR